MHALIDTATEIVTINNTACEKCAGEGFNSENANESDPTSTRVKVKYGEGEFEGEYHQDSICIALG